MLSCVRVYACPEQSSKCGRYIGFVLFLFVPSLLSNLRALFMFASHWVPDAKYGKCIIMMQRQGLVSGQIAVNSKADGMMYPLQELNVTGWHFPPCLWIRLLKWSGAEREKPTTPRHVQEDNARGCELILEMWINYIWQWCIKHFWMNRLFLSVQWHNNNN